MRFIVILFTPLFCLAQTETPAKENNLDLRSNTVLFTLEDVAAKKTFMLERSNYHDHFLRLKNKGEESVRKIDSRDAKKLDMDFASRFIKIQYEFPPGTENCTSTYRLGMKGEDQGVCEKEDQKSQVLAPILLELTKRFQ